MNRNRGCFPLDRQTQMEKTQPIRVLHMAPLSTGGITKLTVTLNALMDPEQVRFDYLVFRDKTEFMESQALALGGQKQVVNLEGISNPLIRLAKKMTGMVRLMRRQRYDVVHVDASTPYDVMVALAAKVARVPVIVLHAHNDSFHGGNFLRNLSMPLFRRMMPYLCTDFMAVSQSAASFMFPAKVFSSGRYTVVKNGVLTQQYAYSPRKREEERFRLGLSPEHFVLGHIGRFVPQKNHGFLLEVFAALHQQHPQSRLLLIGEGPLLPQIRQQVAQKGLTQAVIFYGVTHDVSHVLCAMDAFVFPSQFEGLGIAAVEAQIAGLPVWCSQAIPPEARISHTFQVIKGWDAGGWACSIWNGRDAARNLSGPQQGEQAGYDLRSTAIQMQNFYRRRVEQGYARQDGLQ